MAFEKLILEQVAAIGEKEWKVYDNGHQKWSYAGFEYRCDKWEKSYRALYTRPKYEGQQGLLEFARPDNIIVTNLSSVDLNDECLIYHHHQRGADELPHRGLKEFGSEQKHKRNKRVRVSIGAPWKRRSMLAMSQLGHYVNRRNVQAAVSQVWPIFFGGRTTATA